MGLTIHYSLRAKVPKLNQARFLLAALRRRALELPFEHVGEIIERSGAECDFNQCGEDDPHRWLLIQAGQYVEFPGSEGRPSFKVAPRELVAFETMPGPGCEPANYGLCRFPAVVEVPDPEQPGSNRRIPTKLSGWRWSSFCKTEYSSCAEVGGYANFLKCHMAIVRLLEYAHQIRILDGVHDEGEFWENRHQQWLAVEIMKCPGLEPLAANKLCAAPVS